MRKSSKNKTKSEEKNLKVKIKIEKDLECEEEIVKQSIISSSTFDIEKNVKNEPEVNYELIELECIEDEEEILRSNNGEDSEIQCKICFKTFDTKTGLNSHKILHVDPIHECIKCGVVFKKISAFKKHKCLICPYCKKIFYERRKFEGHVPIHSDPNERKLFVCDYCGKKLKIKASIYRHVRDHVHTTIIKCEFCDKVKNSESSLKIHIKNVHRIGKTKCKFCNKEFNGKGIYAHMRTIHGNETFNCPHCGKSFTSRSKMNEHQKIHDKKLECKICGKKYASGYELNQHNKLHDNPKAFECKICKKDFCSSTSLYIHSRLHNLSKFKILQCDYCSFITHQKPSIKYHVESHVRKNKRLKVKKPYECKKCGVRLENEKTLIRHLKRVHPIEKCKCDLCGVQTKTKDSMKVHIEEQHLKILSRSMKYKK